MNQQLDTAKQLRNDRDGSGHALLEANGVAPGRARRWGKGEASGWRRSRTKSEELRPLVKTMGKPRDFHVENHGETNDGDVDHGQRGWFYGFL